MNLATQQTAMAGEGDEAGSRMSMQLVLMNCLKEKKYGDALSACNALLARFPTDAMALECKALLTEKAELAEMPTDGEEDEEESEGGDESSDEEDDSGEDEGDAEEENESDASEDED